MPIIGCTKEDNCKKDAYLRTLARARAKEKGTDENVVSNVVEVANASIEIKKSDTARSEEKAEAEEAGAENIPTEDTAELAAEEEEEVKEAE